MASTLDTPLAKPNRHIRTKVDDLSSAIKLFLQYPGPRIIGTALLAAWSLRLFIGEWTLWDALIGAAIIAFWPIQEWLIHVFILHLKPIKIGRHTFDLFLAQKHREHHQTPWDLPHVFTPVRSIAWILPTMVVFWLLVMPTKALALTGMAVFLTFSLTYEWTHFLVHTTYKPRSAFYRRLWQHHRLHHFKSEKLWYGVSMISGDKILRTAPDHRHVETSPTCRDILARKPARESDYQSDT